MLRVTLKKGFASTAALYCAGMGFPAREKVDMTKLFEESDRKAAEEEAARTANGGHRGKEQESQLHRVMSEQSGSNIRNPRNNRPHARSSPWLKLLLPATAVIAGAAAFFVIRNEQQRDGTVCVNCARQKEIMKEIYFDKIPEKPQLKNF